MRYLLLFSLFLCVPTLLVGEEAKSETAVKLDDLEIIDVHGVTQELLPSSETKAIVFVFISTSCPVSNSFQPVLASLREDFKKEQVAMIFLHTDGSVTTESAQKHATEFKITVPVSLDDGQRLAKALGAKKTPEAVVLTKDGRIAYRGRIHDGFGKPKPTTHDLRDAITAVLNGQQVAVPRTTAVGCPILFERD